MILIKYSEKIAFEIFIALISLRGYALLCTVEAKPPTV